MPQEKEEKNNGTLLIDKFEWVFRMQSFSLPWQITLFASLLSQPYKYTESIDDNDYDDLKLKQQVVAHIVATAIYN